MTIDTLIFVGGVGFLAIVTGWIAIDNWVLRKKIAKDVVRPGLPPDLLGGAMRIHRIDPESGDVIECWRMFICAECGTPGFALDDGESLREAEANGFTEPGFGELAAVCSACYEKLTNDPEVIDMIRKIRERREHD